jgi:XTP/dITP diphosphohydrolase
MEIILATHNKNKVKEMQNFLSGTFENLTVITASEAGFTEDIEENALIKARAVRKDGAISIADDSGLCVNALDGRPGIYSARYAGEPCDDKKNNAKLLSELEPFEDRTAYFVSAIACVLPDGTEFTVRGVANGVMLKSERGEGGFGYDPLFYFPPLDKTFAELSREEKNGVSHRGNALRLLRDELIKRLK